MKLTLKAGAYRGGGVILGLVPSGRTPRQLRIGGVAVPTLSVPEAVGEIVHTKVGAADLLLVSVGLVSKCTTETVRQAAGIAARWMRGRSVSKGALDCSAIVSLDIDGALAAACEGLLLGDFTFERYKSKPSKRKEAQIAVLVDRIRSADRRTLALATATCAGTNLARQVSHEPPNELTPVSLAAEARKLAGQWKLKCRVLTESQMARLKMGGILAVGKGSAAPSRLIILEYGGRSSGPPVVIIGKAVTFDTGGYSLKSTDTIVGMKYDKCGGTAVLGLMRAVGELKPRCRVIGIIAAAENMISEAAYRPDDIVRMMSGKTVEIISTDAEGRLVLADALTYAQRTYRPRVMIDLATLTGGIVVALGRVAGGLFCEDDALRDALLESGQRTHERLWPMPLWEDYDLLVKGDDADLKNSGGRWGHPVIGGVFLKSFVDAKIPWAHLDIAGTAKVDDDKPYCPKGATGFGVRLLVDYLMGL